MLLDTTFVNRAVHHYLDELAFVTHRARRSPEGLDAFNLYPEWYWMLAGDPGHADAASAITPDGAHVLFGFITLWYRQDIQNVFHGQAIWDVRWHPDTGWAGAWRTRTLVNRAWRSYPGDFLVRWATMRLIDPPAMPTLFIPSSAS